MKLAITADLHLTAHREHPERFAALKNILSQLQMLQIEKLIIAGDLFDAKFNNFAEFESLCRLPENRQIQFLVIPGNHDRNLNQAAFTADNVRIFSQPELVSLDSDSPDILFIPYREGKAMGDLITDFAENLKPSGWVLIGHGDWMGKISSQNPYEAGIYMPLSQRDIDIYMPKKIFLGHIHAHYYGSQLYYPGSPCGIDISETGWRRFLTYDTLTNSVDYHLVDTQIIYFSRTFTVYPVDDELRALENMLQAWIASWAIDPHDRRKVLARVKVNGYATNKNLLKKGILDCLGDYRLYEEPDLSELSLTSDLQRSQVIGMVKEQITQQRMPDGPDDPDLDQILFAAMQLVYGG